MKNKPIWLQGKAAKVWDRLIPALKDSSILDDTNADLVAAMCHCYGQYLEAVARLNDEGMTLTQGPSGRRVANPLIEISKSYLGQYMQAFKQLKLADKPDIPTRSDLDDFVGAAE